MDQVKQKTNFNQSFEEKTQKLQDKYDQLITCIENLSNELFYEIFDYLDGCEIYKAFSRLNHRFHKLLYSSSFLFKLNFDIKSNELYGDICRQIISLNKHQILSFYFNLPLHIDKFLLSFTINSSFDHLQSLNIQRMEPDLINSFLIHLAGLPRLSSLIIETWNEFENLNEVYRLIFALPMLKYNKFDLCGDESSITLPMATKKQLSTIQHLDIDHSCTFNELASLTSYTPELRRLNFMHINSDDSDIGIILPMTLSNLTHLSMHIYYLTFDRFEIFIKNIYGILKVLRFNTRSEDVTYLNAVQWERVILQNLPRLEKLEFQYIECLDYEYGAATYLEKSNQFTSPFWIVRKWIFQARIEREDIVYSIGPYKKRWYEYAQPTIINSSLQLTKSAQLTLTDFPLYDCLDSLFENINSVLSVAQMYHLVINEQTVFCDTLIEILFRLPELVSLEIHSLSLSLSQDLFDEEGEENRFLWVSKTNKIRKVYLEEMNNIEEVYCLMEICPRMNYLQVNSLHNIDVELFVRNILMRINVELRLLCIRIPTADDQLIEKLNEMLNSKQQFVDYKIKRVNDKIHLQWT